VGADLPLIARRGELAILTGAIEAAKSGRGEAVLITGEAGVGKSRLLVEAQREAESRGLLILKGRAWNQAEPGLRAAPSYTLKQLRQADALAARRANGRSKSGFAMT
jgi:predicted ATPase